MGRTKSTIYNTAIGRDMTRFRDVFKGCSSMNQMSNQINKKNQKPENPYEGMLFDDGNVVEFWDGENWKPIVMNESDNRYKEFKTKSGAIISAKLNGRGKIVMREVDPTFNGLVDEPNLDPVGAKKSTFERPSIAALVGEDISPKEYKGIISQPAMEEVLKEVCSDKMLNFVATDDRLESGTLDEWRGTSLVIFPNKYSESIKNQIMTEIKKYGSRLDSLSWEKDTGGTHTLFVSII